MGRLPPMVAFAAPSGTGKTTLIEGVLRVLVGRGLRVGVLKSDAHRLQLDQPGKDTWRFRQAGAWRAVIAGDRELAVYSAVDGEQGLAGLVDSHLADSDLVLVEGFRRAGLPTVRVDRRAAPALADWKRPRETVAWVSDRGRAAILAGGEETGDLPILPLDQPEVVADWLVARVAAPAGRPITGVIPVGAGLRPRRVEALAAAVAAACDGRVLLVGAQSVGLPAGLPAVSDLRPGLGVLGALLTALAAVDTPDVLLVGAHAQDPSPALLAGLRAWGPKADVVVPVRGGHNEPTVARYGHRCLSAIQGALLSGEYKLDGWWGQVRVERVPEAAWRAWDPDARSFAGPGDGWPGACG